jgi:hypothetical protein
MAELMPRERFAEIVADAAVRAATEVTGIFRNERMTWTEQGIHAAARNAVMHDDQVTAAIAALSVAGMALPLSVVPTQLLLDELASRLKSSGL